MQPTAWTDSVRTVQADLGWVIKAKGSDDDRFWEYPFDFSVCVCVFFFFKKKRKLCSERWRDVLSPPLFFLIRKGRPSKLVTKRLFLICVIE